MWRRVSHERAAAIQRRCVGVAQNTPQEHSWARGRSNGSPCTPKQVRTPRRQLWRRDTLRVFPPIRYLFVNFFKIGTAIEQTTASSAQPLATGSVERGTSVRRKKTLTSVGGAHVHVRYCTREHTLVSPLIALPRSTPPPSQQRGPG